MNSTSSVARAVDEFLNHAERMDAGLIVVSSHGRRGFPRMLFGSFAETLLNLSNVPLLFLNHNPRLPNTSFERVLWATDFFKSLRTCVRQFLVSKRMACATN